MKKYGFELTIFVNYEIASTGSNPCDKIDDERAFLLFL